MKTRQRNIKLRGKRTDELRYPRKIEMRCQIPNNVVGQVGVLGIPD